MSIPHLEILGFIGSLSIATFAAWTAAMLSQRTRMVERDLDIATDQLAALQRAMADAPRPQRAATQVATPAFVPLYTELNATPLAQQMSAAMRVDDAVRQAPSVRKTAEQLRQQSPAAVQEMLQPKLKLTSADATALGGHQVVRLMEWLGTESVSQAASAQ
jgi:hypothetical protein